jgi:hypothetical protein
VLRSEEALVTEMIAEAARWWSYRLARLKDLEEASACDWRRLAPLEQRLDQVLSGVCAAPKHVEEITAARMRDKDPAALYIWARVNLPQGLVRLSEFAGQGPLVDLAIVQALEHSFTHTELSARVAEWLTLSNPFGDLAVLLASRHGLSVGRDRLQMATARLGPRDPVRWAHVLERLGNDSDCIRLQSWLGGVEGDEKQEIAQVWLHLGAEVARSELRRVGQPWAVAADFLTAPGDLASRAPEFPQNHAFCYALGLSGEAAGIEVLLARLDDHPDAMAAARALDLLTGVGIPGIGEKLPTERVLWEGWLAASVSRFASMKRMRLGQPCDSTTTLAALQRPSLPPSLRRHLVREWECQQGKALLLDVDMLVAHQEQALLAALRAASPAPSGRRPA